MTQVKEHQEMRIRKVLHDPAGLARALVRARPVIFSFTFALCFTANLFQAGAFDYDPSTCSTEADDTIHVALDSEVFRFPKDDLVLVGTAVSSSERTAPIRADPFGCPGNPVRAMSFALAIQYLDQVSKPLNPMTETFELLTAAPDFWGLQTSDIYIAQLWCTRSDAIRGMIGEQMEQCRVPSPGANADERGGAFRAISHQYSAPFDKPFVVLCLHTILTSCEVHYKYLPTVNLRYKFTLSKLPPRQFIDFDRALRAKLDAARRPDYPWAN
jgi:hypothetical protein